MKGRIIRTWTFLLLLSGIWGTPWTQMQTIAKTLAAAAPGVTGVMPPAVDVSVGRQGAEFTQRGLRNDVVGTELPRAGTRAPNILFILIDDLGWADLGRYGNRFNETPNIDRLASQGMTFTNAYAAAPVCSPTRASILSGQYPARIGLTAHIPLAGQWRPFEKLVEPPSAPAMPLELVTIAESLQNGGYATAHFGKWHLGPPSHYPEHQGFETSIVRTGGGHLAPGFRTEPNVDAKPGTTLADLLTDQALQFIREHRDRPFFVYLGHYAVHMPLQGKPGLVQKYRLKTEARGYANNPVYAAMVEDVDHSVGRLMRALNNLDLANDTLVVVSSDNGGLYKPAHGRGEAVTRNAPLRDEKGTLYEGGIRVPLIVRWPGVVKPGGICRAPVSSVDFYPTFLEIARVSPPTQPLDGESLLPPLDWLRLPAAARALFSLPSLSSLPPRGGYPPAALQAH